MIFNEEIQNAYKVLEGKTLTRDEALKLIRSVKGNEVFDLISLANKVKDKFAPGMFSCSIINAKSGICSQNCRFCAQSAHYSANIETYDLLPKKQVLAAVETAHKNGVKSFGYVTSGRGYLEPDAEFELILDTIRSIKKSYPAMRLCVSIGILSHQTARILAENGVDRYNINLQTAPRRYAELIADTHSIEEKIQTVKYLQEFGVSICCGGIFGLGETEEDRVDMALAFRDLDVDGIPLNLLLPIPGTPLEDLPLIEPVDAAKAFAICRLLNPTKMIKFAAGRETTMKDYQALLMLSGINALMTGGYLTTRGRSVAEDQAFMEGLAKFTN